MKLGCIGDDFTGSSDLANTLAKGGLRVTQFSGVPDTAADPAVQAGVVALKTRTMPVDGAVARTLAAADWLKAQGCEQYFFKYCSTFDSTPKGNIGPVIDALMSHLGAPCTIACPAFPATGRSVYQGHLFVNDRLHRMRMSLTHGQALKDAPWRCPARARTSGNFGQDDFFDTAARVLGGDIP